MISPQCSLREFNPLFASTVVSWVKSKQELFWLAPGTPYPLTAAKLANWTRERGTALLLFAPDESMPCGYGEVNPLRTDSAHAWLGHLLIDPARRGAGLGHQLTQELVRWAFDNRGIERLTLVVFPDNLPAIQCYHKCGFQSRGEELRQFNGQGPRHKLLRFELFAPSSNGAASTDAATGDNAISAPRSADFAES